MSDPIEQFRLAIAAAGLEVPDMIHADGSIHRFSTNGRQGDDSGWYVFHPDGLPAGAFGCWREGITRTWCSKSDPDMTAAEREAHRQRVKAMQAQREAEQAARHQSAAADAAQRWQAATPCTGHPYLAAKGVQGHGVRVDPAGALIVPMRDAAGTLHSLHTIAPDGDKRFLSGGRVKGCYHSIGTPSGGVLIICEGYATGASIHEATGQAVAVAFNAGNLEAVALALRAKYPAARLIVAADDDDDVHTNGNPGMTKAKEAARAVGALLAVPDFGANRLDGATDFNDLHRVAGLDAVRACIAAAKPVEAAQGEETSASSREHSGASSSAPAGDSASPAGALLSYRRLSEIQARPIRWMWQGRIARGKVSIIAGHPGLGKSQVCISMAATVTTGGRWPVTGEQCEAGSVVFLSAEDDPGDTIRPRLKAAGADLDRCFILDAVRDQNGKGEPQLRSFNLKTDLPRLEALLAEIGDVALIVIDPITAYMGDTDSHNNADVRALLAPLGEMAARHAAAVVCVSHLNKMAGGEALLRVTGSLGFVAAARAAFIVAKDSKRPARRLFLPVKNNIGKDQTGLAFTLESHPLPGGIETSRVAWEAEAVTVTADEAIGPADANEERSATAEATDWLKDLLALGPMKVSDVQCEARQAGFSEKVLRCARNKLGIKSRKSGFTDGWSWSLPGSEDAQGAEDAHTN